MPRPFVARSERPTTAVDLPPRPGSAQAAGEGGQQAGGAAPDGRPPGSGANTEKRPDTADKKFLSLYNQAKTTGDRKKQFEIIHEMQKMEYDAGGYIIWGFNNRLDGYSTKVKGLKTGFKSTLALNQFGSGYRTIWFG